MYYGDAIAIYKLATVYYSFSKLSPEQMTFAIANLKLNMLNLFVIGAFRHPFLALVPLMRILWYPILAKKNSPRLICLRSCNYHPTNQFSPVVGKQSSKVQFRQTVAASNEPMRDVNVRLMRSSLQTAAAGRNEKT